MEVKELELARQLISLFAEDIETRHEEIEELIRRIAIKFPGLGVEAQIIFSSLVDLDEKVLLESLESNT